jgi:hypothetical protein
MDGRVMMMMIGGTLQQQMGSTVVLMMMMVGNGTDVKEVKRDSCCSPRSLDHFHLLFQNKRLLSLSSPGLAYLSFTYLPGFFLPFICVPGGVLGESTADFATNGWISATSFSSVEASVFCRIIRIMSLVFPSYVQISYEMI